MARANRNIIPLQFGELNVAVPEHLAPDATLRAVKNLIPMGTPSVPFWGAPNSEELKNTLTGILGIVAHSRGRIGDLADLGADPNQTFERIIALTDGDLHTIDPGDSYNEKSIHTFTAADVERKLQGAQLGEYMYLAISGTPPAAGIPFAEQGFPEPVLEVRDDAVLPLALPDLPTITITSGVTDPSGVTIERKLKRGRYPVRYSWQLRDGTLGPPTVPVFFDVGSAATTLNGAVSQGDTTFVVNSILNLITAVWETYEAGLGAWDGTLYVEDEVVVIESIDFVTSTLTLVSGTYFALDHADASDVDTDRGYWVRFEMDAAISDTDFEDVVTGVQISLGLPVLNDEDALRSPYYNVVTIQGNTADDEVYFSENEELIPANPLLDETLLTQHTIGAAAAFTYNSRLHLGDLMYDFRLPVFDITNATGATKIRPAVKIRTENGVFERIGAEVLVDSATLTFQDNLLMYPDIRAIEFIIYMDTGTGYFASGSFKPKVSNTINLAYFQLDGATLFTLGASAMPDVDTTNGIKDRNPNRFIVSEVFKPRHLSAQLVYEVGDANNDLIIGFSANSLAVSDGQFGQYPLIVLSTESVSLASVGAGSIPYVNLERVANRGCVGRYAFTNVEDVVFFASRDGIWGLGPTLSGDAISSEIHYHYNTDDLFSCLTNDTALGYYNDNDRGRRELWVAAGKLVFGYSPRHGRWFVLDRERKDFQLLNGKLYSVSGDDDSNKMYDDGAGDVPQSFYLRTNRMNWGSQGVRKRIHRTTVRQTVQVNELFFRWRDVQSDATNAEIITGQINAGSEDTVSHASGWALEPVFECWGLMQPGQGLVSLAVEYDLRQPQRARALIPQPAVITGSSVDVSDIPWDCANGFIDDNDEVPTPLPLEGQIFIMTQDNAGPINLRVIPIIGDPPFSSQHLHLYTLPVTSLVDMVVDYPNGKLFTIEVEDSVRWYVRSRDITLTGGTYSLSSATTLGTFLNNMQPESITLWRGGNSGAGRYLLALDDLDEDTTKYGVRAYDYDGTNPTTYVSKNGLSARYIVVDPLNEVLYYRHRLLGLPSEDEIYVVALDTPLAETLVLANPPTSAVTANNDCYIHALNGKFYEMDATNQFLYEVPYPGFASWSQIEGASGNAFGMTILRGHEKVVWGEAINQLWWMDFNQLNKVKIWEAGDEFLPTLQVKQVDDGYD